MSSRNIAATISRQGQWVNGPKEVPMARRRYQKGSLVPKTGIPRNGLWVGRWREDVIQVDGTITRPYKWEVLGTIRDYPTRRLALRALEARLSTVNNPTYRARPTATLAANAAQFTPSQSGSEIQQKMEKNSPPMKSIAMDVKSLADTEAFGRRLAGHLFPGAIVALIGGLGAG